MTTNRPYSNTSKAQPQDAYDTIAHLRTRLNWENTLRAMVSTVSIICMGISLLI